ncbi:MAG TPA: transposase [Chloroflexota bacterium]|nr:transposase [Chloroflexota bacterium]
MRAPDAGHRARAQGQRSEQGDDLGLCGYLGRARAQRQTVSATGPRPLFEPPSAVPPPECGRGGSARGRRGPADPPAPGGHCDWRPRARPQRTDHRPSQAGARPGAAGRSRHHCLRGGSSRGTPPGRGAGRPAVVGDGGLGSRAGGRPTLPPARAAGHYPLQPHGPQGRRQRGHRRLCASGAGRGAGARRPHGHARPAGAGDHLTRGDPAQARAVVRLYAQRWAIETGFATMHAWGRDAFMVRQWTAIDRLLWVLALAYALLVLALTLTARSFACLRAQALAVLTRLSVVGDHLTVGKLAEAVGLDYQRHQRAWSHIWLP